MSMTAMSGVEGTERATDFGSDTLHRVTARVERGRQTEEAVDQPVVAMPNRRHARILEPAGVRLALIAQRVVLGGDHERGRDTCDVAGTQRADEPLGGVAVAARVAVEEPVHLLGVEQIAVAV